MLKLHHLEFSRSTRILWLLEETRTACELIRHRRRPGLRAPEHLAEVHPSGKLPIIEDGQLALTESAVIMTYINERYGEWEYAPPPWIASLGRGERLGARTPSYMDCLADEISSDAEISSARPIVCSSKSTTYTWHTFCSVTRVLEFLDWSKAMQASQAGQQMPGESALGAGQVPLRVLESTYAKESSRANLELVVTELFKAVDCALREEFDVAQIYMQRAATLLRVEPRSLPSFSDSTSIEHVAEPPSGSGLAPWQIRKVRTYIAENLGAKLSIGNLAAQVRLSRCHFSRAFKDTFGDTPHRYVLRRRIAHAQGLMLTTKTTLAEIALECGLVDQAHLGRSFRRIVGETPAAWRRARMTEG